MCIEIAYEDIREFSRFSEDVLIKLPNEEVLSAVPVNSTSDEMAKFYIRQGTLVIKLFSDCFEAGGMDLEEACALRTLLVQSDRMLGIILSEYNEKKSCIGQAESEKKECKENCKKKFCGCIWNSFLAKTNCFIGGVDVSIG
jgi:hypothetical protein